MSSRFYGKCAAILCFLKKNISNFSEFLGDNPGNPQRALFLYPLLCDAYDVEDATGLNVKIYPIASFHFGLTWHLGYNFTYAHVT